MQGYCSGGARVVWGCCGGGAGILILIVIFKILDIHDVRRGPFVEGRQIKKKNKSDNRVAAFVWVR